MSSFVGSIELRPTHRTLEIFAEDLALFRETKSPFLAADLLSSAIALGQYEVAVELRSFVSANPIVGPVALNIARNFDQTPILAHAIPSPWEIHQAIAEKKSFLSNHPHDTIAWIERALNYALIGQKDQAKQCIVTALNLAPTDRYVVRSAIRFFVHTNDWEKAYYYANRAFSILKDPWIAAPFLSVGTHLDKIPNGLKNALKPALSSDHIFHYSELLEAHGTLEILNGSDHHARKLFKRAWMDPAKTVVSHSQWVLREKLPGLAAAQRIDFKQSAQAMSLIRMSRMDFDGSVASARVWAFEEPYSVAPFMQLSAVLCLQEKYAEALAAAIEGLIANPTSDSLLNNATFSALRINDPRGSKFIEQLRPTIDEDKDVAQLATYGLHLMQRGQIEEGRDYYIRAVRNAIKSGNRRIAIEAVLNLVISEIDVAQSFEPTLLDLLAKMLRGEQEVGVLGTAIGLKRRLVRSKARSDPQINDSAVKFISALDAELGIFQASLATDAGTSEPKVPSDTDNTGLTELGSILSESQGFSADIRRTHTLLPPKPKPRNFLM